jgi:hypothetical protein
LGSIDGVYRQLEHSLADSALARVMLYRRRAVVAQVIDEFRSIIGITFGAYLDGRAPHAPIAVAQEIHAAKASAGIVEATSGPVPPLLFERAILACMEGRSADALSDLDRLLVEFPGFAAAAVSAAGLALAAGAPDLAIRWLVPVEFEAAHMREGAGLLATALRRIGLYEAASQYDYISLTCRGDFDSRGNDCAPVDVSGKIAVEERMPMAFTLEGTKDGRVLMNDRGNYYLVDPEFCSLPLSRLLDNRDLRSGASSPRRRLRASPLVRVREGVEILAAKTLILTELHLRERWLSAASRALNWMSAFAQSLRRKAEGAIWRYIYRPYQRLPRRFRGTLHEGTKRYIRRLVLQVLRPQNVVHLPSPSNPRFEMIRSARHSPIGLERLQLGVASVFLMPSVVRSKARSPDLEAPATSTRAPITVARLKARTEHIFRGFSLPWTDVLRDLPPRAEQVVNDLLIESGLAKGE